MSALPHHAAGHDAPEQPIILQALSSELLPFIPFNQRVALLEQVVRSLSEGRRPVIMIRGEISVADLARGFLHDDGVAPALSSMMGLGTTADRAAIAAACLAHFANT